MNFQQFLNPLEHLTSSVTTGPGNYLKHFIESLLVDHLLVQIHWLKGETKGSNEVNPIPELNATEAADIFLGNIFTKM